MKAKNPIPLLKEIERFCQKNGIAAYRVAKEGAGNGDLINRLRKGGRVWPETEDKIRAWMQQNTVSSGPLPTAAAPRHGGHA